MPGNDRGPTPKETVRIIQQLINLQLLDAEKFKAMHHFTKKGRTGGTMTRFLSYCRQHESFIGNSENEKLARELQQMLDGRAS